jgi:uncharacterized lipoprotein
MKKVALLAAGVMVLALAACGSKSQAPKSTTMKPAAPSMKMPAPKMPAPKASTTMKAPKAMTKMAAKSMGKTSSGSKG